ncbi:MAG: 3-phosphoshikimate 1-carboxyvinyltransferase [Oscillospiraceae bacterium]|nr:3-phosphoshikimate 1-carboxyvinyltransferase [Oscillospiraceae bacterium]
MNNVNVEPSQLNGTVAIPPSKSDVHRAIICGALSRGKCVISPVDLSEDIKATIGCVETLGAKVNITNGVLTIDGSEMFKGNNYQIFCNESGSLLRFIIPVVSAMGISATFTGAGRLPERPIGIYLDCLPKAGVKCTTKSGLPLTVEGQLQPGEFEIPGNVSSQFITGLLFALPLLKEDSKIILTSPLESVAYVDITINVMKKFGVIIETTDYGYFVKGNQKYIPKNYTTEGDWSNAAFFMTAAAIKGDITVTGVDKNSAQGDKEIAEILKRFGAKVEFTDNSVRVQKGDLKATDIDARQIPDLVPILAVCATFAEGTTHITGAERLRIKESDRLSAIANAINQLGGNVVEKPDGLVITGVKSLKGGTVQGVNDHRIVMAMSVATLMATDTVTITDMESIKKSFPNYFEEYNRLGGISYVNLR